MRKMLHFVILASLMLGLLVMVSPKAQAQFITPTIKVNPSWRPAETLTSVNSDGNPAYPSDDADGRWEPGTDDDDVRYVDVDLFTTTNMEFWTAQLSCTVSNLTLEAYTVNLANDDFYDDKPMVQWGGEWGNPGADFTEVVIPYNATTGQINFTASRLGSIAPLGKNGVDYTLLLATLRFRVKTQAPTFFSGMSTFFCQANFLNRDGRATVPYAAVSMPLALKVIPGYSIEGTVKYQGRFFHSGIGVSCDPNGLQPPAALPAVRTDYFGKFKIPTRLDTFYTCRFFGNINTVEATNVLPTEQPDIYLSKNSYYATPRSNSFTFLPVTLLAGNVERGTTPVHVGNEDLALVTGNWNATVPMNASGDANGDGRITQADLAMVTSNMNKDNNLGGDHFVVSGQFATSTVYPDSRIMMVDNYTVPNAPYPILENTQVFIGTNRDFWPTVSPDGKTMAFVRAQVTGYGATAVTRYALFSQPADGSGFALRLTPYTWDRDAFAPSWSLDSTKIAFVCSTVNTTTNFFAWQWPAQPGNLCIIDANGQNLNVVTIGGPIQIYPPSWWDNNKIVVAGAQFHATCGFQICLYDLTNNTANLLDGSIPANSDMPIIWGNQLTYRYKDGSNYVLRFATLDADNDTDLVESYTTRAAAPIGGCCQTDYHTDVTRDDGGSFVPISTNVQYYTRRFNDAAIVFYENNPAVLLVHYFSPPGFDFYNSPTPPTWGEQNQAQLNGLFGNPTWDGTPDNPTLLLALRVTIIWQP